MKPPKPSQPPKPTHNEESANATPGLASTPADEEELKEDES